MTEKSSTPKSEPIEGEIVSSVGRRRTTSSSFRTFRISPLAGFLILAAVILMIGTVLVLFIKGSGFLVNLVLPVFETLSAVYLGFSLIVLLPLMLFRATRSAALALLNLGAGLYGFTAWMIGFVVTLQYFGVFWVIVGVLLAGIGVVPLGVLAALFNNDMTAFWSLLGLSTLSFGTRYFSRWLATRLWE